MRYLVTGASGFVGNNLCEKLIENNNFVRAISRTNNSVLMSMDLDLRVGLLNDSEFMESCLKGIDVVVHCAGNASFGNGKRYKFENTKLTQELISLCEKFNKEVLFIFISSIGAIDRYFFDNCKQPLNEESNPFPKSDYGRSKLLCEDLLKKSPLRYVIIRPSMVIGKRMRHDSHFSYFSNKLVKNSIFTWFDFPGRFSIIDVNDLSDAIIHVSKREDTWDEVFFCAGDHISLKEFFMLHETKRNKIFNLISILFSPIFIYLFRFFPFKLKSLFLPALVANDSKLRSTGWEPLINPASTLKEIIKRESYRFDPYRIISGSTIITGAGSGLGRAITLQLSKIRNHLILIDKDRKALDELKLSLTNVSTICLNLSVEEDVNKITDVIHQKKVSELYLCAGIGLRGSIQEIPLKGHIDTIKVNLLARISIVKFALDFMKKEHFGRIILVSSSSAFQPLPFMSTYSASNSAILFFGEGLAEEEKHSGVHVMTVCPGGMKTNFQNSGGVKQLNNEKLMDPEVVARKILSGLQKDKRTLIISLRSRMMNLLSKLLSRKLSNKLWSKLMQELR